VFVGEMPAKGNVAMPAVDCVVRNASSAGDDEIGSALSEGIIAPPTGVLGEMRVPLDDDIAKKTAAGRLPFFAEGQFSD
jgi:hypothetical protein